MAWSFSRDCKSATFLPNLGRSISPSALFAGLLIFQVCAELAFDGAAVQAQQAAQDDSVDSPEERSAFNQVLYRNRQLQTSLHTAVRKLKEQEWIDALAVLQRVLDDPEDAFVWMTGNANPVSARLEAQRILSTAPAPALRLYETLHGPEAARLLQAAREAQDRDALLRLSRRLFHTAAGFEALDWLATAHLEHGDYELAAREWDRLLNEPLHRQRITTNLRLKASLAQSRSGNTGRALELLREAGNRPVTIAGRAQVPQTWARAAAATTAEEPNSPDWPIFLKTARRISAAEGSAPLLRPIWSSPVFGAKYEAVEQLTKSWENDQHRAGSPRSIANFPLVVNGKVIFRDAEGIRAVHLATGKVAWSYRCETSLDSMAFLLAQNEGRNSSSADIRQVFVENSIQGMLASDGQRVYAVDFLDFRATRGDGNENQNSGGDAGSSKLSRTSNRLIALDVETGRPSRPDNQRAVWSVGGTVTTSQRGTILGGHFFLGPPLPVDGRLYAVTESSGQLNVVALRPETGRVEWSQGIALASRPIDVDPFRYQTACTPSIAEGILVCPTELGILAAVDSVSGALLWAYRYVDEQAGRRMLEFQVGPQAVLGHSGFSNLPLIHGQTVVYLPRQSAYIHAVDLRTGRPLWKAARGDAEYVATVWDGTVLVVGRRICRGLSAATGQELWSAWLGLPSGMGSQVGGRYLLPLNSGIVANLDLKTGSQLGYSQPEPNVRPGNLIVHGDVIVSLASTQLAVFPQAESLLQKVLADGGKSTSAAEQNLLAGELQLRLGRLGPAKAALQAALNRTLPAPRQAAGEDLLRELLYLELRTAGDQTGEILDQLAELSHSPAHRSQYLVQRAETQFRQGNFDAVLKSIHEFTALEPQALLSLLNDPTRKVAPAAWVPDLLDRVREKLDPEQRARVMDHIETELSEALNARQKSALKRFLVAYSRWPQAAAARRELAKLLTGEGKFQEAELLLLQNRADADQRVAAEATRQLAEVWEQLGLYQEAGMLLSELRGRFADVRLADGRNGRQYLSEYPRDLLSWEAAQRLLPIEGRVEQVRITELRDVDERLRDAFSGYRRRLTTGVGGSYELLEKGSTEAGRLVQIDRETGIEVATIEMQGSYSAPNPQRDFQVGHFIPIAGLTSLSGLSLLERRMSWKTVPAGLDEHPETIQVGPCGPEFCTYQSSQNLYVLHPGTGEILWQRENLESNQGQIDVNTGLLGDREVLVLFSSGGANGRVPSEYTVYKTSSGEELRRGKLDISLRQNKLVFGRMLAYVTDAPSPSLRIWDPLTNKNVLDENFAGRALSEIRFAQVRYAEEIVVALPTGRTRVISGRTGAVRLDVNLPPEALSGASLVVAFADEQRYYLNLQRSGSGAMNNSSGYVSDAMLPMVHMQGDFYAIDRATNEELWHRQIPQQSIVYAPDYRLPFLMALSRVRSRAPSGANQALRIDIIDCRTGDTISSRSNIVSDRLVQMAYERDAGRLELRGPVTQIRLEFDPGDKPPVHETQRP